MVAHVFCATNTQAGLCWRTKRTLVVAARATPALSASQAYQTEACSPVAICSPGVARQGHTDQAQTAARAGHIFLVSPAAAPQQFDALAERAPPQSDRLAVCVPNCGLFQESLVVRRALNVLPA